MTEWQWKVILALIRLILKIEERTNDDNHEWFDAGVAEDRSILQEALERNE